MMHAYCYVPRPEHPRRRRLADAVLGYVTRPELLVSSNVGATVHVEPSLMAAAAATARPLLELMDFFILEGTENDPELGFLVAHAIAMKKPALYLYQRGTTPELFHHLNQKLVPPTMVVAAYSDTNLPMILDDFLERLAGRVMKEVPRIKFTLRVTSTIDAFLHYKTHNTKQTKAEYLRTRIEQLMADDEAWKNYRRQHRLE